MKKEFPYWLAGMCYKACPGALHHLVENAFDASGKSTLYPFKYEISMWGTLEEHLSWLNYS